MSTVFRLDASIRENESVTRAIADRFETALTEEAADVTLVRRDVAKDPLDPNLWALTQDAPQVPPREDSPERAHARRVAAELANEMETADAYVFAAPLYNFGVSQHIKTWVDVLFGDERFAPGQQPIAGRPAYLAIARGGGYAPGTPKHGWDHGTGWLQRIFGDILGLELTIIEAELQLARITPGMEELHEQADANLATAHEHAEKLGRDLADQLS